MKRLVIVTGGSAGIGAATAARFVARGEDVVTLSRRPCPVPGVASVSVDLTSDDIETQVRGGLAPFLHAAKRPIVLVHNAALLEKDTAVELSAERMARVLAINVVAPAALNRVLFSHMSMGSCILYVGSTLSEKAVPGAASYITSKHAVVGLMRATCQDLAGKAIHTACICPGFTDTEMLRAHVGNSDAVLEALGAISTFGRLCSPDEVAQVVEFCADNAVINGSIIHANLGQIER
jgi:3-oxoacyl-[acyl-carrier protein] reductase